MKDYQFRYPPMTKARAAICEHILLEKEGHVRDGEWWRTPIGVWPADQGVWDVLASSLQWLYDLEGELMQRAWKFGARDGVFVAYRRDGNKLVTGERRDEVIGMAYLMTTDFVLVREQYN